jgi:hypothetical protein
MHDPAQPTTKGTDRFRESGAELENLLRGALALVGGTRTLSRAPVRRWFRDTPRHELARSAGHLLGYALLGYIAVHQRRGLKHAAV